MIDSQSFCFGDLQADGVVAVFPQATEVLGVAPELHAPDTTASVQAIDDEFGVLDLSRPGQVVARVAAGCADIRVDGSTGEEAEVSLRDTLGGHWGIVEACLTGVLIPHHTVAFVESIHPT